MIDLQLAVALTVLAMAVAYAAWRIYRSVTQRDDPCKNCSGCKLKKKSCEKFGDYKKK